MRLYRLNYGVLIALALAGCSSPPEPAKVEWSSPATAINETVPRWQNNHIVVPSKNIMGAWSVITPNFNINEIQSTETYYAIAHASHIVIKTSSNKQYFTIKNWLLNNGATNKIEIEARKTCLLCQSSTLYFYHEPVMN
ncbi:cag pathogenicity island Cag12 family protein [Providencia vermicola]|uniref:cag pathogenicity island Cag12 family protein n=1 Tax=Providencia vermicola TaxID=333965 RepID=UPI0032DAF252